MTENLIIGTGKLGRSLAQSMTQAQIAHTLHHRDALCDKSLCDGKIVFLAVPDDAIANSAQILADTQCKPAAVVYCAGVHTLNVLAPLQHICPIGMFHPLISLDGHGAIPEHTFLGIAASTSSLTLQLHSLAKSLHLDPHDIVNGKQAQYHAAASVAGNLPYALMAQAIALAQDAGLIENVARPALAKLMRSCADNLEKYPVAQAMTGPIARGDDATVAKHINAIASLSDDTLNIEKTYTLLNSTLQTQKCT